MSRHSVPTAAGSCRQTTLLCTCLVGQIVLPILLACGLAARRLPPDLADARPVVTTAAFSWPLTQQALCHGDSTGHDQLCDFSYSVFALNMTAAEYGKSQLVAA